MRLISGRLAFTDDDKPVIDGSWIRANGLQIYNPPDAEGEHEFVVNGSNGQMTATNCDLTFQSTDSRNVIKIDPTNGINIYNEKDTAQEEKVFEADMHGEVRMKGTLHSSKVFSTDIYGTTEAAYGDKETANVFPAMTDKSFNITQYVGGKNGAVLQKFGVTVDDTDGSVVMIIGAGTGGEKIIGDITYRTGAFAINKLNEYTQITLTGSNVAISLTENDLVSSKGGTALTLTADKVYVHSGSRENIEEVATVKYVDELDLRVAKDIAGLGTRLSRLDGEGLGGGQEGQIKRLWAAIEELRNSQQQ